MERRPFALRGEAKEYNPALAAMLIYLNRTGYNGLFRLIRTSATPITSGLAPRLRMATA